MEGDKDRVNFLFQLFVSCGLDNIKTTANETKAGQPEG
jgi:hypothetical protein